MPPFDTHNTTPALVNLSLDALRPASTAGWAERASFQLTLTLSPRADVKDDAIVAELNNARGGSPESSDYVLLAVLHDLTKTVDRAEIGGQLATMIDKGLLRLAPDKSASDIFGGLVATDFNHNCQPWRSTKTFAWYTLTPEQRDNTSEMFKGVSLDDLADMSFQRDDRLVKISSGPGADEYKRSSVPAKKHTFFFKRVNTAGPIA